MKKLKKLLAIVLLNLCHPAHSQNMVQNGSFESYVSIPAFTGDFTCSPWLAISGTPDLLTVPATVMSGCNIPYTFAGTINAYEGSSCIGFSSYMQGWPSFREYFGYYFDVPLIVGNTYEIRMMVLSAPGLAYGGIGTDCFEVAFTTAPMPLPSGFGEVINFSPQCVQQGIIYATSWKEISFQLYADSAYQYMTVGCFQADSVQVQQNFFTASQFPSVYTFVDNVKVSCPTTSIEELENSDDGKTKYTDMLGRDVPFKKGELLICRHGKKRKLVLVFGF